ncbi:MAG: alpha-2-macroglobulin, partial [Chloroflexi bacterium]|nr:alpha-2-macroglobulin [Chloroflexota bacterium]
MAGALDGLFVRQNFKDTAYWSAVVNTDAGGRAQVQVTLPDNLTTWKLDARAITLDTKVGQASSEIVSTKPLLVRSVTPRFFVVGDSATLGAVVNNNTDSDIQAEVALDAKGVTLANPAPQQVTVKARGTARVDWDITVDDAASAELTFSVKGGGLEDSSKPGLATAPNQGIPILRYASPETVATAGDLSDAGQKLEIIALPERLDTGQGQLDIQVDPSLASVIKTGERALEEYAYESAETTASRLLVNVAMPEATSKDLATRAIQNLLGSQHSDGGWGWWVTDNTNNAITAYVLLALARAQTAGYSVDVNALTRAREYLISQLVPVDQQPSQANLQALMLFALTEAGVDDSGRLGALYENKDTLNYASKALLAVSLDRVNKGDERVKGLLSDLMSGAVAGPAGMMWQEKEYDYMTFGSNTRSTAIALYALARLDPNSALASNVVRWLMVAREGDTWETNQEIAWAVLGLSAWQTAVGEKNPDYTWRVTLNNESVINGQASQDKQTESSKLTVEVAKLLKNQANQLMFERGAGNGRMYYTARLKVYLPADQVQALNRGIVIARKYELADCKPEPGQPCEAITSAPVGQNVRVRLTIVAPNDLYFVRVTDPLPGGAEVVDTSLKTSQQIGTQTSVQQIGSDTGWGWWWFSHTELRDDHAALFASNLPAGTYEYTYVIRTSIAGSFKVMPASVEESYFPETFGRSDGAQFTITK